MRVYRSMPKEGWTPTSWAAARDIRVSWRARGLLGDLLSYPDGWNLSIDKLVADARRKGGNTEGRAAMRAAVKELADVGYVRYIREADEHGHWTTVMYVSDDPDHGGESHRRTRNRTVGEPVGRETETSEDRSVTTKTETKIERNTVNKKEDQKSSGQDRVRDRSALADDATGKSSRQDEDPKIGDEETEGTTPIRGTPPVHGGGTPPGDMTGTPGGQKPASEHAGARARDRELFRSLTGGMIRSDGRTWTEGTFAADEFYDALRKWKREKPIQWPGRLLEKIADDDPDGLGVVDWLLHFGLEGIPERQETTNSASGGGEPDGRLRSAWEAIDGMHPSLRRRHLVSIEQKRPMIYMEARKNAIDQLQRNSPEALDQPQSGVYIDRLAYQFVALHYASSWPKWFARLVGVSDGTG